MTKYKGQKFSNTFKNARKGMLLSIKSERNIRIHIFFGLLALVTAFYLNFSDVKFCILILTIVLVIGFEMINSAIEFTLDAVYHNKFSQLVGMAKDIAAGAVMIVTASSVIIGGILYLPPIIKMFID